MSLFFLSSALYLVGDLLIVMNDAHLIISPATTEFKPSTRQPLILTPYVKDGKIQEGQKAAQVHGIMDNVESYSGYFTVNTTFSRNLFFWYFPAEENPATSPVKIWLQGGPGASSMFGLLMEHGPFQLASNGSLIMRPYRWTRNHHVIYIDSPAGTGFSFPDPGNRPVDEQEISTDLHNFLQQFFQLFPDISGNNFYVAGESYAGYMVPSTAYAIHNNKPSAKVKINLKGLLIGDGIVNLQWGPSSDFCKQIGLPFFACEAYNYVYGSPDLSDIQAFLNKDLIQERIHVGEIPFFAMNDNIFAQVASAGDLHFKLNPILSDLLQHYSILYYYGQLDSVCPYPYAEQFISGLNWSGSSEYLKAKRVHWNVEGDLAGYIRTGGNLSLALVRNAGHMVPSDQPKWCLDLVTRFTNKPL